MDIRYIFFDCMETLIDLTQLPEKKDYALWGFEGSGTEHYWKDFDEFYRQYLTGAQILAGKLPQFKEYDIMLRYRYAIEMKLGNECTSQVDHVLDLMKKTYWNSYKSRCYVMSDVFETISYLCDRYPLGVVSNFMVPGGIEELLKENDIYHFFQFVITSINEGWKKPHKDIFRSALKAGGMSPKNVLFIGDDYVNDYIGSQEMGMNCLLLDRYDRHPEIKNRVKDFASLKEFL